MSNVIVDKNKIDILANAISCKSGEPVTMTLDEMVSAVDGIETGGGEPNLQAKTYTVYSAGTETITADVGYDGLSSVAVNVPQADFSVSYGNLGFITENTVRKWKLETSAYAESGGWMDEGAHEGGVFKCNAVPANTTVTPTESAQTIGGANYMMEGTVTVNPIPSSYVQPTSTVGATTYRASTSSQTIASGTYHSAAATIAAVSQTNLTADNIKSGTTISISNGQSNLWSVTGTYTGGGGGDEKNIQIVQNNATRITATSYTKACGTITVSKTGTYDIYWDAYRTSSSGTWGTQWYKNGTAQGTAQTSFSNSYYQTIHLTNISLAKNDTIDVYGRSRGNSYYLYVGTLIIKEV